MHRILILSISFILLSSFQCSKWAKYAETVNIELQPVEPRVINDSIALTVQITTVEELNKKAGLVELDFYYLPSSFEKSNFDLPVTNSQKVTSIQLENDVSSQTEVNLKFKWLEGHSLYVQQLITKKKRKTHSPLLIIMESIENNTPQQ